MSVLHFPAVFPCSQAELAWGKQPGEHKLARVSVQTGRSMDMSVPFHFPPVLDLCLFLVDVCFHFLPLFPSKTLPRPYFWLSFKKNLGE